MAAKRERDADLASRPDQDRLRLYVRRWESNVSLRSEAAAVDAEPEHDSSNALRAAAVTARPAAMRMHHRTAHHHDAVPYLLQPMALRLDAQSMQYAPNGGGLASSASLGAKRTGFVYHPDTVLHHRVGGREVERPDRVVKTLDHLTALGLVEMCVPIECKRASTKDLSRVHSDRHIDTVDQWGFAVEVSGEQSVVVGCDLYACKESSRAARLAAGGAVEAALAVVRGDVDNAFALVRPPGHHCSSTQPGGFCFFNNVAVAVRAAQTALHALHQQAALPTEHLHRPRVLVVDWDVHHCDGTEEIFYDDPSVLVFSIHQYGSKPKHTLRKQHNPDAAPRQQRPNPDGDGTAAPQMEVELDELAALLDGTEGHHDLPEPLPSNDVGGDATTDRSTTVAEPEPPAAVAVAADAPSGVDVRRSARQRQPVDFKALNATLNTSDGAATAFFASAGLLPHTQDGVVGDGSGDGTDRVSSVNTRDLEDDDSFYSSGFGSSGGRERRPRVFDGDEDGDTSSEEDVDRDQLYYPGTGHLDRIGDRDGLEAVHTEPHAHRPAAGRNVNFPWPTTGLGDLEYIMALEAVLAPIAKEFQPEMIFVSCGFDAAEGDLLGSMKVTPTGFRMMTRLVLSLCPKVVVALEGGYNVAQIAKSSEGVLREMLLAPHRGDSAFAETMPPSTMLVDRVEHTVQAVKAAHAPYWQCFQPTQGGKKP